MAGSNNRILLVEDNSSDELLTLRVLKRSNIEHEVDVVRDGQEALDYLFCEGDYAERDASDTPRVVILDLHLPKINGHEVLRRIRAETRFRDLPVIVFTSSSEESDVKASHELGASSHVRKPVNYQEFSEAVKQISTYWLNLNRTAATQE